MWNLGSRPVVVDGLDAAAVGAAVANAEPDVIVHQMTTLAGSGDLKHFDRTFAATNRLRTVGTDNLLAAAQAVGVPRVIAQSFAGWPNERSGGPVKSETDPFDADPPRRQRATLAAIRHLERAVLAAPLDGVVVRYGIFYGPGASDDLVALVRKGRLPIVGSGPVERAVFLLHDVFGYEFAEIASIVGRSADNCRQVAVRARRHVNAQRPRFEASREQRERLADRFVAAVSSGEVDALIELLAADVVVTGDSGGMSPSWPRIIAGRDKVARLLGALSLQIRQLPVRTSRARRSTASPAPSSAGRTAHWSTSSASRSPTAPCRRSAR